MFVENNVMQQHRHAGDDVYLNERLYLQWEYSIIILYLVFIYSKIHLYTNIYQNEYKLEKKICIMHFAGSLLKFCLAKSCFKNFCMEYYWCHLDVVVTIL